MNLYKRDFTKLTAKEDAAWRAVKEQEHVSGKWGELGLKRDLFRKYPKAARHFVQLFPNHYLDDVELENECQLREQIQAFSNLLDSEGVNERAIVSHIKRTGAYFIVGAILKSFYPRFGHHEAYLFPEFQLGNTHQVDYLLVGKGSGGYEFVFVEFEAPSGRITTANGDLGDSFRKGLFQVAEWDAWLEARYVSLKETFDKYVKPGATLPDEFTSMDKSRLHFTVVAGRRVNFQDRTYRIGRKKLTDERCRLLHYDNLVRAAQNVIGKATY